MFQWTVKAMLRCPPNFWMNAVVVADFPGAADLRSLFFEWQPANSEKSLIGTRLA